MKSAGHSQAEEHLHIERIDFCVFGNSKPFRIKIVNNYNEVHDYFYIKIADASRICGLEMEHILSPYSINYLVADDTLVEEHIAGIPGDVFAKDYINRKEFNPKRIAKEFVKFNERCFVRLLGDMRSYNFVFDITQDFDDIQFRIRAIDFDQQCYEGRKNIYLPQFFKENLVSWNWSGTPAPGSNLAISTGGEVADFQAHQIATAPATRLKGCIDKRRVIDATKNRAACKGVVGPLQKRGLHEMQDHGAYHGSAFEGVDHF